MDAMMAEIAKKYLTEFQVNTSSSGSLVSGTKCLTPATHVAIYPTDLTQELEILRAKLS